MIASVPHCLLSVTLSSFPYVSLYRVGHNIEACFIRVSKEEVEGGGVGSGSHTIL